MNKKYIRKMQTAAGGRLILEFTPEQIALFENQVIKGMNINSNKTVGESARKAGVNAVRRKQRLLPKKINLGEMHTMVPEKTHQDPITKEVVIDSYKDVGPNGSGAMSGADPLLSFYVGGVGLNGIGALAKTGLWNVAKYAPTTQLGNWGRGYFVGNTFKNSFNEISGTKKLINVSKPNINVAADIGTTAEQKISALSLEQIEKAFNQARQWHLNRINSSGYKDRALRAGFTEEEIPQLLQLLTRLINSLKLQNKEKLFPNNFSYEDNFGKINAEYWRLPTNKGMFLGIGFYNPNMSYDEAVSKFIHEFGHGATFGLNGNETTGLAGKLSKQFPLIAKAVLYNKSLFPEVTEETVKKVFPYAAENGKLEYYSRPTESLAKGYEFMRDYANNWWKLKNSGNSFTNLDAMNNAANSRLNSKLFRELTGNSGAYNFQKNALGISIPLGLGYSLYNNDNLLQLQYLKQGGKMNILEFLKNGSGIHIKKKNKGKFTSYCGGKVTDECIRKAKASGNPTLVKRATFALNARHFKHRSGGVMTAGKKAKSNLTKRKDPNWDNLDRGYRYLTLDMKLPHDLAIALMGNVVEESQGNHQAILRGGPGRGLIQWEKSAPSGRYSLWGKILTSVTKPANVYDPKTDTVKNYWASWNGLKGELVRQRFKTAPLKEKTRIYAESYLRPGKPRIKDRQLSAMQLDSIYNPKIKNIIVNKKGGKAFVEGVNALDSNPKAYKHVKKKYKVRSAQWGSKLANIGIDFLSAYNLNNLIASNEETAKSSIELEKSKKLKDLKLLNRLRGFLFLALMYDPNNPNASSGGIVEPYILRMLENQGILEIEQEADNKKALIDSQIKNLKANNWLNFGVNTAQTVFGLTNLKNNNSTYENNKK